MLFSETLVTLHLFALKSFEGALKIFLVFCKLIHCIIFWNLCFFVSLFMDIPIQVQGPVYFPHTCILFFRTNFSHRVQADFLWGWGPSPELNAFSFTRIINRHDQSQPDLCCRDPYSPSLHSGKWKSEII